MVWSQFSLEDKNEFYNRKDMNKEKGEKRVEKEKKMRESLEAQVL